MKCGSTRRRTRHIRVTPVLRRPALTAPRAGRSRTVACPTRVRTALSTEPDQVAAPAIRKTSYARSEAVKRAVSPRELAAPDHQAEQPPIAAIRRRAGCPGDMRMNRAGRTGVMSRHREAENARTARDPVRRSRQRLPRARDLPRALLGWTSTSSCPVGKSSRPPPVVRDDAS